MAELITVTCDVCGAVKGKANHWFKALTYNRSFYVSHTGTDTLMLDTKERLVKRGTFHKTLDLCSESCVSKALSRVIGAGASEMTEKEDSRGTESSHTGL